MKRGKHLYWVPCATQFRSDAIRYWRTKRAWDSRSAQVINTFIYGHHCILAIFRQKAGDHNIIRPDPTRFVTWLLPLKSLYKHRVAIREVMKKKEYLKHVNSLVANAMNTAKVINKLVYKNSFWESVQRYLRLVEPIVQVLRMVDGDNKNDTGYLYKVMDIWKEIIQRRFPTTYQRWWDIIDSRWEGTLHHWLHGTGKLSLIYFFSNLSFYIFNSYCC